MTKRSGGSRARHAGRTNHAVQPYLKPLKRTENGANPFDDTGLQLVEDQALSVLENLGVDFGTDGDVISLLTEAGAEFKNGRVHFPKGMCLGFLELAPKSFIHHARNPEYSVEIGGLTSVFTLSSGASFVRGLDGERRPSMQGDLVNFVKLAHLSPSVHAAGFMPCQASDIDRDERYLDALFAHIKYSDKPIYGAVGSSHEALHSIEVAKIVFGDEFLSNHQVLLAELSSQSPLKFDQKFLDILQIYASSNQASIISPMALLGITCPMSIYGALVQVTAEFLAGAVFAQIVKAGSPVIFGVFPAVTSMQSGTLSFSSPEGAQFLQGVGQMARRLGVPFRTSGGVTSSKSLDSQASFESRNGVCASIASGANIISNCAGSLEAGMTASYQKFITDSDQLAFIQKQASKMEINDFEEVEGVISEGILSGSFLGSSHTKDNFQAFDGASDLSDNNIFEQWRADGEKTSEERAVEVCKAWLENYEQPPLDQVVEDALCDFIKVKRKSIGELPKRTYNNFPEADCQATAANHLHDNMWGDVFRRFQR